MRDGTALPDLTVSEPTDRGTACASGELGAERQPAHASAYAWLSALAALVVLVALAVSVASGGWVVGLDHHVRAAVDARQVGWFEHDAAVLTDVFSPPVDATVLVLVATLLAVRRRTWRPLVLAAVALVLLTAAVLGMKHGLGRPSPSWTGSASAHGGSFPSGHTASVLVSAGTLMLLRWRPASPRRRDPLRSTDGSGRSAVGWSAVAALTTLVGGALVYAEYHWLSDVAASVLLGTAELAVLSRVAVRLR